MANLMKWIESELPDGPTHVVIGGFGWCFDANEPGYDESQHRSLRTMTDVVEKLQAEVKRLPRRARRATSATSRRCEIERGLSDADRADGSPRPRAAGVSARALPGCQPRPDSAEGGRRLGRGSRTLGACGRASKRRSRRARSSSRSPTIFTSNSTETEKTVKTKTREQKLARIGWIVQAAIARVELARSPLWPADRGSKDREAYGVIQDVQIVPEGYAEPGYGGDDDIVALGNWNTITRWDSTLGRSVEITSLPARVGNLLEKAGASLEWSDEWTTCCECQRAVRTSPDSYSWKRAYTESDDGARCEECTLEEPESYLASLEGNPDTAVTLDVNPEDHGYVKLQETFENGYHTGQDDSPEKIAAALQKRGIARFLFSIDQVGQFDLRFSVYVHESEADRAPADIGREGKLDVSPAERLKEGLRNAALAQAKVPPGDGPIIVKINGEGGASARRVSPQDFLDGRGLE